MIKHPTIDPAAITEFLGIEPSHCAKAGEARRLPNGEPLPGVYRETSWTLSFPNEECDDAGALARKAIAALPTRSKLWPLLRKGAGKARLILSIVGTKYQGEDLGPDLIGHLAEMGIGLGLEIYAVPQN